MVENIKENGYKIKCMVQDDLNGPMADVMKGIIRMINKEGYGIFHWPDGRIYEGAWKEGKIGRASCRERVFPVV